MCSSMHMPRRTSVSLILPRARACVVLLSLPSVTAFLSAPPLSPPSSLRQPVRCMTACTHSSSSTTVLQLFCRESDSRRRRPARGRRARATSRTTERGRHDGIGRVHSCMGTGAIPLDEQSYKVVTAWRYPDSSSIYVPWKAVGDALFEMGAFCVSVRCRSEAGDKDGDLAAVAEGLVSASDGNDGAGITIAHFEEEVERGYDGMASASVMLTFTVNGGRDVRAALEEACTQAGATDCLGALDWEEDPVECSESWEAAAVSDGFETVYLQKLQVSPVQRAEDPPAGFHQMKLLEGQGWGDGEHPSTWMCLEFLEKTVRGGEEEVIDYGTGSGVLATAAALLGANHVTAVDVDLEILAHAKQNFLLNGVGDRVSALHTRDVSTDDLSGEVVVVNMLAGPMRRLMPVLVLAVRAGGLLGLSGLRPSDIPVIKRAYGKYIDWDDDLEASRTSETWGEWMRIVGRPKPGLAVGGELRAALEREFSEMAVS